MLCHAGLSAIVFSIFFLISSILPMLVTKMMSGFCSTRVSMLYGAASGFFSSGVIPLATFSQPSILTMEPAILPSSCTLKPCDVLCRMATRFFSFGTRARTP